MAKIGDFLTRRVGPLPMGVWILAVGGGLALAWYMNRTTGFDEGEEDSDAGLIGPADLGGVGVGSAPGGPTFAEGAGTFVPQPPSPTTNDEWLVVAASRVVATTQGVSRLAVDRALRLYLLGDELSSAQESIVEIALRQAGPPPEGVSPSPPAEEPPPAPEPPTGIPGPRWHSSTPDAIAAAFPAILVATQLIALKVRTAAQVAVVDFNDVYHGLRKLGWRVPKSPANLTTQNLSRLTSGQRKSGSAGSKPPTSEGGSGGSAYYVWHSSVAPWFAAEYNVWTVVKALRRLNRGPRTRFVTVRHVQAGLTALGCRGAQRDLFGTGRGGRQRVRRNMSRLLRGRRC